MKPFNVLISSLLAVSLGLLLWGCTQTSPTAMATQAGTNQNTEPASTPGHETGQEAGHTENQLAESQTSVEMPHIHGLGYTADGRQLFVAAHAGLRVFADGRWSIPDLPPHDYMGYAATDNGFYSSGHPHPAAGLVNPLGLVKSGNGGQTFTTLGFEGESDFHLMGVGYRSHAIYVFNPAPNSRLAVGLYYSLDEGQSWQQSALQGLAANPIQIAVHPTEANRIALATEGGFLLSSDYGDILAPVGESAPITAVAFAPQGDRLLFGAQTLSAYTLAAEQLASLPGPPLASDDAVAYLAINPTQAEEITLATFQRHIYRSLDGGQSWLQIAQAGQSIVQ